MKKKLCVTGLIAMIIGCASLSYGATITYTEIFLDGTDSMLIKQPVPATGGGSIPGTKAIFNFNLKPTGGNYAGLYSTAGGLISPLYSPTPNITTFIPGTVNVTDAWLDFEIFSAGGANDYLVITANDDNGDVQELSATWGELNQNNYNLRVDLPSPASWLNDGHLTTITLARRIVDLEYQNDYVINTASLTVIAEEITQGNQGGGGITPVPEPATMSLFGLGLMGLTGIMRKKSKKDIDS